MKKFVFLALVVFSSMAFAQNWLPEYHWTVTDVASLGLNKETLFKKMDTEFVKPHKSICSNRAHMWVNNFKQIYGLNTAKIFLFYTEEKNDDTRFKVWWYHVAPMISENGNLFVMDPALTRGPRTKEAWFKEVSRGYDHCKEIKPNENELIELMFTQHTFPKNTSYGRNNCYYRIVPHPFWIPQQVAMNLLGHDEKGMPVRLERHEIDKDELYQACIEATTSKIEFALGANKKKCKEYVGL